MKDTPSPPSRQTPSPASNAIFWQLQVAGLLLNLETSPATRGAINRLRDAQLLAIWEIALAEAEVVA